MRLNAFLAKATDLSRRAADRAIANGRVKVNNQPAHLGQVVDTADQVVLDGRSISLRQTPTLLLKLNKPAGYVCSRRGQGSATIYQLLPPAYQHLQPVGRLDKQSTGLLLLTDDGHLLQQLAHPSSNKIKLYNVVIDRPLDQADCQKLSQQGVDIGDSRPSKFIIKGEGRQLLVSLAEGRKRQIRRSFAALGYEVTSLQRLAFGDYRLGNLALGKFEVIKPSKH